MSNYFSGDWEYNDTVDAYETAFEAVRFGPDWNGLAAPVVTRRVMNAFVHRQQMLNSAGEAIDWMILDGNGVMVEPTIEGGETFWLLPDEDDNFDLTPLGYALQRLSEDDNVLRRIAPLASDVVRG